ncbi:MAG TPA: hypothetical protein VKV95_00580 [Terriglobia bacterium]|nr:hypothetical protein [Terriglobia bacterium]
MNLTNQDAFQIPMICSDIGFSVGALAMLDSLGKVQEPLAEPVAKFSHYYQHWGPGVGQQISDVEARLSKYGLPVPPCWHDVGSYAEWYLAIIKTVKDAAGPDPAMGALVSLGHSLGLLTRSIALYFVILRFEAIAPQNEAVLYRTGRRREDFLRFVNEIAAAANQAALPAAVRPLADELVLLARSGQQVAEMPSPADPADQATKLERIYKDITARTQAILGALGGGAANLRLTPLDAFMFPLICIDVGIPIAGFKMLSSLGPAQGPLAARVEKYVNIYRQSGGPFVAQQISDAEGRLSKYGLAIPPLPQGTIESYAEWYLAIVKTAADAAGAKSAEGSLVLLGDRLGQVMLTLALHVVFLSLRVTDPQHEVLRSDGEWSRRRLYDNINVLAKVVEVEQVDLPPGARPYAVELANQARMAQRVDEMPEPGGFANQPFRLEFVQRKLFEVTFALRAALGDRSPLIMNPTGVF